MKILLVQPNQQEQDFDFDFNSSITVGGASYCDIVVSYPFISRVHCTFVLMCSDEQFYYLLFDGEILGKKSTNGVYVNHQKIQAGHIIKNKDKIYFHENAQFVYLIVLTRNKIVDSGDTYGEN